MNRGLDESRTSAREILGVDSWKAFIEPALHRSALWFAL